MISYKFKPIVRMSNTYMKSGATNVNDLFDSVDYGIYLKGSGGPHIKIKNAFITNV